MGVLGHKEGERSREHGFTMAELLIVVAIVAVLVAIAIPVFSAQLEKSREAVDLSTVRSAYADYQMCKMMGEYPGGATDVSNAAFFVYTKSGHWKQVAVNDTISKSEIYLTQSKSDLSEINELFSQTSPDPDPDYGYHDRAILIYYYDYNNPYFCLNQTKWLPLVE